jgi:ABC-type multidrug transport system fused ATPase/permease subunit
LKYIPKRINLYKAAKSDFSMDLISIIAISLFALIIIALVAIVGVSARIDRQRRRRMAREVRKMKELNAAVSHVPITEIAIKEEKEEIPEKKEVKSDKKRKGDKTIYDDRKNLSTWQEHLSKTFREMKKKNPKAKFSDAMKAAKKTYKKK